MKTKTYLSTLLALLLALGVVSCSSDDSTNDGGSNDNFDREAMLVHWADNLIIPAYQNFAQQTNTLKNASYNFNAQPTQENLNTLREEWQDAYIAWQNVELYNFGPAIDLILRANLNIYPTNTTNIDNYIESGNYNLIDPNLNDEQGFPALDYLLFGIADSDTEILQLYDNDFNGEKYRTYLGDVVDRADALANEVVNEWENNYRNIFILNSSSSANSSINRLANAYLEYYERFYRNGKFGIPSGILSNGTTAPGKVEAPFKNDISKVLALESLTAMQDFFNGSSPLSSPNNGPGFRSYLDFLDSMKGSENVSVLINNQFDETRTAINNLDHSFANQIITNNNLMLVAFEELQDNVVYLKSDMFSALSITLDFESGDGD